MTEVERIHAEAVRTRKRWTRLLESVDRDKVPASLLEDAEDIYVAASRTECEALFPAGEEFPGDEEAHMYLEEWAA